MAGVGQSQALIRMQNSLPVVATWCNTITPLTLPGIRQFLRFNGCGSGRVGVWVGRRVGGICFVVSLSCTVHRNGARRGLWGFNEWQVSIGLHKTGPRTLKHRTATFTGDPEEWNFGVASIKNILAWQVSG
jgi:hypothetical protein